MVLDNVPLNIKMILFIFLLLMINWIIFFIYLKIKHTKLLKKFALKDPFNESPIITFYNPLKFGNFLLQITNEPDPILRFFKITHLILIITFGVALASL